MSTLATLQKMKKLEFWSTKKCLNKKIAAEFEFGKLKSDENFKLQQTLKQVTSSKGLLGTCSVETAPACE